MASLLEKATRGERARIEALIAREEARVRSAFRRFLDSVQSNDARRQVRLALEREGIEMALRVVDAHVARMGGVIAQVFQSAGTAEAAALAGKLRSRHSYVAISFDPTYPRAADLMRRNTLSFVRGFTGAQRESTRAALTEALRTGAGTVQTARMLRESIGLTETQRRAVENYRSLLEDGDVQALSRDLRDRRFDSSVLRAVEDGEPLGAEKIARMVEQYRNRYLQYRAETIARTETLRVVGQARLEALEQTLEQIELPRSRAVRIWAATQDERTRDTHSEMDGQRVGLDEPFVTPDGYNLLFPGDGSLGAPASEIVNCRCTEYHEILEDDE